MSETAAWAASYLLCAMVIIGLDYGNVADVSATPDNAIAAVPLLAGFVGMGISRYLWKRRGGHLQPSDNRFTRAFAAMRGGSSASRKPASRSSSTSVTAQRPAQRSTTSATQRTASNQSSARRPAGDSTAERLGRTVGTMVKESRSRSAQSGKSGGNRWGRALGAMLDPDSQKRKSR